MTRSLKKQFSVQLKVYLALTFSFVLIFGLISYILINNTTNLLKSNLNEESKTFASLATTPIGNSFLTYQYSGTIKIDQQVQGFLGLDPDIIDVNIVSTNGNVLFSSQNQTSKSISSNLASAFNPVYAYDSQGYIRQIVEPLVEQTGIHEYAIVYNISTNRVQQDATNEATLVLYIAIFFLIISSIGTNLMLNRLFIVPLRRLSKMASVISLGNYDQEITYNHQDEIGNLARALNTMAGSLKADITKLQDLDKLKSEFMMVTSHNLRTPLTIIRGYIEMAEMAESTEEIKKIIETISENVNQLHVLAEEVLTISTLESGNVMAKTLTQVKPFLESIDNEISILAKKRNLSWEYNINVPEQLETELNQTSIRTALIAVLDNAIKFNNAGGQVKTVIQVIDNNLVFKVEDNGVGIDETEMPKLFTKFHRGTSTLQYDYEGEGIGLYLTKLIVEQHGGSVSIESQKDKGTICTIKLPLTIKTPIEESNIKI